MIAQKYSYMVLIQRLVITMFLTIGGCNGSTDKKDDSDAATLPLPSSLPLVDYEKVLYRWILERKYSKIGWAVDKGVRDTGPYIQGAYYGTHPAVRIYYSPEVMRWLAAGRPKDKPIKDGAMIIKEMFTPPAALYQELANDPQFKEPKAYNKLLSGLVGDWTIMVKDSQASSDGWFWGSVSLPEKGQSIDEAIAKQVDTKKNRKDNNAQLRFSGFGMPCLRCHASADDELTFSELDNIAGQAGEPLTFFSDNSWRTADHFKDYPLGKIKDLDYVKRFFNLPKQQLSWATQQGLKAKPSSDPKPIISSDHDLSDNLAVSSESTTKEAPANKEFLDTFKEIGELDKSTIAVFPPQWLDHVVMPAEHPTDYVTSDNCIGCHGGLGGEPPAVTMFIKTGPKYGDGYNVSEYGEWRWSPMGLAGRDPIFHSQLESEMAILADNEKNHPEQLKGKLKPTQQAVTNTCLSCHGAMGQRQLAADAKNNSQLDANFKVDYFYLEDALTKAALKKQHKAGTLAYDKYGDLAREGISCMVCHHIDAPDPKKVKAWQPKHKHWLTENTPKELAYELFFHSTGAFNPGSADEVFGPVEVLEKPMEHALTTKPVKNDYIKNSQMCGTCHTINLPNIGLDKNELPVLTAAAQNTPFKDYFHTIEQATFLEWQNSVSGLVDENGKPGPEFKSCQDCHMPDGFNNKGFNDNKAEIGIDKLVTQIATIQDASYAEADNALPIKELTVPLRDDYRRHTHVGLNVFLLTMFDQFDSILGVNKKDYMTSADNGAELAINSMIQQAQETTVDIDVDIKSLQDNILTTAVTVINKTGHRLPSGVAFRRVFIEFLVLDGDETIWGSGRTNSVGVILGVDKEPLKTEFLPSKEDYQKHHSIITQQDQVQIYEELNLNAQDEFTTSFIHRVTPIKDNRLLPKGWRFSSFFKNQGEVIEQFMEATDPKGVATSDKDYQNPGNTLKFAGQDSLLYQVQLPAGTKTDNLSVKATLYSQSIPPYWLKQRFQTTPKGKATRRLHYLASRLDLSNTDMADWKLKLVSSTDKVD